MSTVITYTIAAIHAGGNCAEVLFTIGRRRKGILVGVALDQLTQDMETAIARATPVELLAAELGREAVFDCERDEHGISEPAPLSVGGRGRMSLARRKAFMGRVFTPVSTVGSLPVTEF